MTKQTIRFAAAVMTTLLALLVLWQFRTAVIYVLLSLMLAATLRPLIIRLVGRGVVARVAWILVYLTVLGAFLFVLFLSGDMAIQEIRSTDSLSTRDVWGLPEWLAGSLLPQALVAQLPAPSHIFEAVTGEQGQLVLPALLGFTQNIGSVVSGFLVVLLLSIYWSINQSHFERLWLSLLPSEQRKQARDIWRRVEYDAGAYLRGEVTQSLLSGLLLGLGYWLLGSPYPILLAVAGALAALIPVVGVALTVIPLLLVGLLTSVQMSLFTALYAFVILIALAVWVKPRLFKRRWENPILTVILLIALADVLGFIGIVVAPLLSVVCQILWSRLVRHPAPVGAGAQISDLKERQAGVLTRIRALEEAPPVLVTSSLQRLAELIEQAESILHA
jgi:predicted PurR-regulated permease PerM